MDRSEFHFLPSQALLGLSLATLLIGFLPAQADEPTLNGTLSGSVVGPNGKPVADARVWLDTYGGKTLAETRTDAAGRFRLGPVESVYRLPFPLMIEAHGLARHYVGDSTTIPVGTNNDLGTIALARGRRFSGQVLDKDGKPRALIEVECSVWYHYMGHTICKFGPSWRLTTDTEGRFQTPPLPVGEFVVSVHVQDRQVGFAVGKIAPGGEETLEPIRLREDVPISGYVRDEKGLPVAGAEVRANGEMSKAISDAKGEFVLRGFGPDPRFQLQLHKEGYVFVNWSVAVSPEGFKIVEVALDGKLAKSTKDLTVTLRSVAWIEGRALDADTGEPVQLKKAVLCQFERKPDGEIVRRG
jgi:hypothetical protein